MLLYKNNWEDTEVLDTHEHGAMLCMVLGTLRKFSVSDFPLDNPMEICDLGLEGECGSAWFVHHKYTGTGHELW